MILRCFIFLSTILAIPGITNANIISQNAPRRIVSNRYFEILSSDNVSLAYVNSISQITSRLFKSYFNLPDKFNQLITVILTPEEDWKHHEQFLVESTSSGKIYLSLSWGEKSQKEFLVRGLIQSLGVQYFIWNYGHSDSIKFPLWLEVSISEEFKKHVAPAYQDYLLLSADLYQPIEIRKLINTNKTDDINIVYKNNSYWFLHFLINETGSVNEFKNILNNLFKSRSPMQFLSNYFTEKYNKILDVEFVWIVSYYELTNRKAGLVESLETSSNIHSHLSSFTYFESNEEIKIPISKLWKIRDHQFIHDLITSRLLSIKHHLVGINPVFHNSLMSLGETLEHILENDLERVTFANLKYLDDIKTAEETKAQILELINQ